MRLWLINQLHHLGQQGSELYAEPIKANQLKAVLTRTLPDEAFFPKEWSNHSRVQKALKESDTPSLTLSLKIVIPKGPTARCFIRNKWDLRFVTPRGQYCEIITQSPQMQETRLQSLGWEDPPGEEHGNPLQYSCLENFMNRGAWRTTVHGVTKSCMQLSDCNFLSPL